MTSRSLGHRAPLLWLVLPLMAGLAAGKAAGAEMRWGWLAAALGAAGIAVWAAWRAPRWWAPTVTVAMLLAGVASYALHRARLPAWDALPPREARVSLRLDRVFPQIDAKRVAGLATVVRADAPLGDLAGQRLYFSLGVGKGEPAPDRGARVAAVGVIVTLPRDPPADSFDGYLAGAGMNFRLTRGRIGVVEREASAYRRWCARMGRKFSEILGAGVAAKRPELTAVFRAMLLGQKHELSDEQDSLFMHSGTMHLFAISGLHIGVIAVGLQALLSLARVPRVVRFVVGLTALWLYVDITGAAPSAVRAFVMVALLQASLVLRTPANPLAALAASALVVLLAWPLQFFSASFQMSYGIVAALLLLGLPLGEAWLARWRWRADLPKATWRWHQHLFDWFRRGVVGAVAIGVASTLVSAVTGVMFFGLFTPGALLANLVLIPAASVVILGGVASLLAGLAGATALSGLFNHAAVLVLLGIDASVRWFVRVPGMWHGARFAAPWVGAAALGVLVAALLAGYAAGWRRERGGWWPPFAVVAVALIFGVKFG